MPQLPSSITLSARRIDAVVAVFRAGLRDGAFDTPRAARVGCPLIAQAIRAVVRPVACGAIVGEQRPWTLGRGSHFPVRSRGRNHRDRPLGRSDL